MSGSGSTRTIRTNVRLVAATNRDLDGMVANREFRSDLFYRLNVFPIIAPPLRERIEDVPLLVRYFAQKLSRRMNKQIETVPEESMNAMMRYRWPGNIRELENFVERAVILTKGTNLNAPVWELERETGSAEGISNDPKPTTMEAAEREHILATLTRDQLDHQRTERRCRPSWNEANNPPVPHEEAWDFPACATSLPDELRSLADISARQTFGTSLKFLFMIQSLNFGTRDA